MDWNIDYLSFDWFLFQQTKGMEQIPENFRSFLLAPANYIYCVQIKKGRHQAIITASPSSLNNLTVSYNPLLTPIQLPIQHH